MDIRILGVVLSILGMGGVAYIAVEVLLKNLIPAGLSVVTLVVGLILLYQE